MSCGDATASSLVVKVLCEVFAHFQAFAVKYHSCVRNSLFGLHDEVFVINPLEVKPNASLYLCFLPNSVFSVLVSLDFPISTTGHAFFPERFPDRSAFDICTSVMLTCCRIHQEIAPGRIRQQIDGRRYQPMHPAVTDSSDTLVVSSNVASRCYHC